MIVPAFTRMPLKMLVFTALIGGLMLARSCNAAFFTLDGDVDWMVTNSNGSIHIPAIVPGGIYTDLIRNGVIGDPYFRDNDILYKWIGYENWTFSRSFEVNEELLKKQTVALVCHGLDTVSQIFINGEEVAETDNMFVRYVIDVKEKLQVGQNKIEVKFQSAVLYAKEKHLQQLNHYVIPPTCPLPVQNGECHVNFIRKIQSSFSWDWGPSFPSQGIWKKIGIEAYDSLIIRDLTVITSSVKNKWKLELEVFVERTNVTKEGVLEIRLDKEVLLQQNVTFQQQTPQETSIDINLPVPTTIPIELWWPNGYGGQKLYNLSVNYKDMQTSEVSNINKRIGFRTIQLVQDNITQSDVAGENFYFQVNGVPIFAKGSNLIPLDSFPERVTPGYIRWLMESAVAVNMNMLRVWGGGMYQTEELYEAADELGVLLWQDFMFACALYPVDDHFLQSVTTEVTQQVRRLQAHSSICLWSGNNENEAAIAQAWWPQVKRKLDQYESDYAKLYVETIHSIVKNVDPTRPFLISSPTNALPSEARGMIDENPVSELYGDVHFYDYFGDSWNWTMYPRPRFASEYGLQSYPSFHTLAAVSISSDWTYPISDFLIHRQHHIIGDMALKLSITKQLALPTSTTVDGFKDYLYLTQVTQAMGVKTQTEHYRRSRSDLVDGKGHTMGALYWQLNNIWQGASWSSIDFPGNWKMLHYFARDFFAPILVSPFIDEDIHVVKVSVVSDLVDSVNVTLNVSVYDWSSFNPKFQASTSFLQPPQLAKIAFQSSLDDLMKSAGCQAAPEACFLYFRLTDTTTGAPVSENFIFPTKLNQVVGLRKAKIQIEDVTQLGDRLFQIRLMSDRIAPFVWLDTNNVLGTFSSNGFLLMQQTLTIGFNSTRSISLDDFKAGLTVQSLMDTQDENSLILQNLV